MDALIMCGGRGTRLETAVEKPLFEVGGVPMIDRVLAALDASRVTAVTAAVSPHAPDTRSHLEGRCSILGTPGEGYVEDLSAALPDVGTPVLTVAADLPLLDREVIDRVLDRAEGTSDSLSVVVPTALKRELGASVDVEQEGVTPSGCNVVTETSEDTMYISYDARLAVNVNRQTDARLAEVLACA